jgi:hypothetical protein
MTDGTNRGTGTAYPSGALEFKLMLGANAGAPEGQGDPAPPVAC